MSVGAPWGYPNVVELPPIPHGLYYSSSESSIDSGLDSPIGPPDRDCANGSVSSSRGSPLNLSEAIAANSLSAMLVSKDMFFMNCVKHCFSLLATEPLVSWPEHLRSAAIQSTGPGGFYWCGTRVPHSCPSLRPALPFAATKFPGNGTAAAAGTQHIAVPFLLSHYSFSPEPLEPGYQPTQRFPSGTSTV